MGDDDYVLHFDKGQLPPWSTRSGRLNLAWPGPDAASVTAAHRYAIRSTDNLRYNADASLDIYIQRRAWPGGKPTGCRTGPRPLLLNVRLYWPR